MPALGFRVTPPSEADLHHGIGSGLHVTYSSMWLFLRWVVAFTGMLVGCRIVGVYSVLPSGANRDIPSVIPAFSQQRSHHSNMAPNTNNEPEHELGIDKPVSTDTSSGTSTDSTSSAPFRKTLVEGEPGTLTGRPLRLYADGIFDLFHFGHAKALQQCKEAYPNTYLLVGCCSDEITHRLKGRTVMTDQERYESLRHCKWVDEVVEDAPWVVNDAFIEKHKIDYVCHDALPYSDTSGDAAEGDVYARIKAMGKFLETRRTDGISTSDLIIRIVAEAGH
ncbi:hypothetical protein PC119_g12552 [Phytophthora cactorum]|nr:hypothetical protein PC119_g12552 [Phytophthora cactorum]